MDKIQTLHNFWSGFDLPAYDETDVPDDAVMPYITYSVSSDDFGNPRIENASLWYHSNSWEEITKKEQEIAEFITRGGRMLAFDGGALWLQKGHPWAQRLSSPNDDTVRLIVLTIIIEFLD